MIRLLFLCLLILPLTACDESGGGKVEKLVIRTKDDINHHFKVELALTPSEQAKGLMFREEMKPRRGMLFYFKGEEAERRFWMKNTYIPLDIIFIRKDGTIHHIHENAVPHDLTAVSSQGPVAAVLEINAGLASKKGLFPGDRVIHRFFQ